MRVVRSLVLPFAALLCLVGVVTAQTAGQIKSMKLLTADVGWAATSKKLFWTTDTGAQWKDITPKLNHKMQMVSSVFFLDTSTGWVLLSCGDDRDPIADDVCFEFALTTNAGESWSVVHPKVVDPVLNPTDIEDGLGFSGGTSLHFADQQHGWVVLQKSTGLQQSLGEMLRTADGGKTWEQTPRPPIAGEPRFVNPKDGWLAGGPGRGLYFTHDAGNSWQEMSLPKPATVGPDTGVDMSLPVFENERLGFLPVRYSVGPLMGPDLSTSVLFVTDDGGRTWRQGRVIPRLPVISSSDLAGSVLIAAHSEQVKTPPNGGTYRIPKIRLSLYTLGADSSDTTNTAEVPSQGAATQLSFVDRDHGWADLFDRLLATTDSGATWVDITPGGAVPLPTPRFQAPAHT